MVEKARKMSFGIQEEWRRDVGYPVRWLIWYSGCIGLLIEWGIFTYQSFMSGVGVLYI
jgi:hypothetical protein